MSFEFPEISEPVYFLTDPSAGAQFTSSAGVWKNGALKLEPEEARSFTITLIERPGHEPLGYWPMDDDLWTNKNERMLKDAQVGGSLLFTEHEVNSGITGADLRDEATFAGWVKLREPVREEQFLFGQREQDSEREFSLRYNSTEGFVLVYPNQNGGKEMVQIDSALTPTTWNHFAFQIAENKLQLYVNGEYKTSFGSSGLIAEAPFTIGASHGQFHAEALLDDFRLWNRAVEADELIELYQTQAKQ